MSVIPCEKNKDLRKLIKQFAEVLKTDAHKLGGHGLEEEDFYNSGVFRGAIERVRGQFAATKREKREFVRHVLNFMQDRGYIKNWESAGEANRYDCSVTLPSGRLAAVGLKGCLDGNNTTLFERPQWAHEFVIWSVCTSRGADPRHNAWSGIHTRLSTEIISRRQRVDGVIVWDMVCGTAGRPCPKLKGAPDRVTEVAQYKLPPPCIYVLPATIPAAHDNPHPVAQALDEVHFVRALHECYGGVGEEINFVDFAVENKGADTVRKTRVVRAGRVVQESSFTVIQRS
jgi:hypothetical protein